MVGDQGLLISRCHFPKTVETVSGEVISVSQITPNKGMGAGVHMTLEHETTHLGPSWSQLVPGESERQNRGQRQGGSERLQDHFQWQAGDHRHRSEKGRRSAQAARRCRIPCLERLAPTLTHMRRRALPATTTRHYGQFQYLSRAFRFFRGSEKALDYALALAREGDSSSRCMLYLPS